MVKVMKINISVDQIAKIKKCRRYNCSFKKKMIEKALIRNAEVNSTKTAIICGSKKNFFWRIRGVD